MEAELELPEVLKKYNRLNVKDYSPNPIAVKLGYCCNICGGMKTPALYGEKVCLCPIPQQEIDWMQERERLILEIHAKIDYKEAFICDNCHKLNPIWGQSLENVNVCKFCNHKQPCTAA